MSRSRSQNADTPCVPPACAHTGPTRVAANRKWVAHATESPHDPVARPDRLAGRRVHRNRPRHGIPAACARRTGHRLGAQHGRVERLRGTAPGRRGDAAGCRRRSGGAGGDARRAGRRRTAWDGLLRRSLPRDALRSDGPARHAAPHRGQLRRRLAPASRRVAAFAGAAGAQWFHQPGGQCGRVPRIAQEPCLRSHQGRADQSGADDVPGPARQGHRGIGHQPRFRRDSAHGRQRLPDAGADFP